MFCCHRVSPHFNEWDPFCIVETNPVELGSIRPVEPPNIDLVAACAYELFHRRVPAIQVKLDSAILGLDAPGDDLRADDGVSGNKLADNVAVHGDGGVIGAVDAI